MKIILLRYPELPRVRLQQYSSHVGSVLSLSPTSRSLRTWLVFFINAPLQLFRPTHKTALPLSVQSSFVQRSNLTSNNHTDINYNSHVLIYNEIYSGVSTTNDDESVMPRTGLLECIIIIVFPQ